MDRLVGLFNSADPETTTWVRIPVINYLRACPLPKAKEYIEELRKVDPKAVEQSETLYAVGPDPSPSVTTQRADSAAASKPSADAKKPAGDGAKAPAAANSKPAAPAETSSTTPAAPANSSGGNSDRMLPIAELIVAISAVIGALVLVAVNRSGKVKSAVGQTKE